MNTSTTPSVPLGRVVTETAAADFPAFVHPEWVDEFPWLVQGTTGRGEAGAPFDLGLYARASRAADVMEAWRRLQTWTGFERVVHAHQVHGARVHVHHQMEEDRHAARAGLHLAPDADGHVTYASGTLLAVTTADCVPVFVVDAGRRAVALLHAGWRSTAGGILGEGVALLSRGGSLPGELRVHLGPAICGGCYEVGPEVFAALGLPQPEAAQPVDVRGVLAAQAVDAGVEGDHITISSLCTLCGGGHFFSHRGGDGARQVGFLGVRP